ncbi:hypothetical protein [Ralstonia pseudosolanacearum]|uniref:hypothetical protein n=1 Tax=Ralstonia pseudosolanacearum TaxID=1310165 RepID=UPI001FFBAEC4|nr:hypothetical protein [Ralstonia pseudosolanacearum]
MSSVDMTARCSYISIAGRDDAPIFTLAGTASEWLFASGFWRQTNALLGTMFDQFEEDEAVPAQLRQIAYELEQRICMLEAQSDEVVHFVYRWTPSGEACALEAKRADLVSQLTAMRNILASAAANGDTLMLSL